MYKKDLKLNKVYAVLEVLYFLHFYTCYPDPKLLHILYKWLLQSGGIFAELVLPRVCKKDLVVVHEQSMSHSVYMDLSLTFSTIGYLMWAQHWLMEQPDSSCYDQAIFFYLITCAVIVG